MKSSEEIDWYTKAFPDYEDLTRIASTILTSLLRSKGIQPLTVSSRTKEPSSVAKKLENKSYKDPEKDISDLAGVRIITYLEPDIPRIVEIIRSTFEVIEDESFDKSDELGTDRIGYRSVHFVCRLGEARKDVPEYSRYSDLKFEIQVRTVLQHAWAEIEHDRNYKFAGVLPQELKRRLFLISAMLESADREFAAVTAEIENVSREVANAVGVGDLSSPITTIGLHTYLTLKSETFGKFELVAPPLARLANISEEIIDFGLRTLGDFDSLVEKHRNAFEKRNRSTTFQGFVRDVLMLEDAEKYFEKAWNQNWNGCDDEVIKFHTEHGSGKQLTKLFEENDIRTFHTDDIYDEEAYHDET